MREDERATSYTACMRGETTENSHVTKFNMFRTAKQERADFSIDTHRPALANKRQSIVKPTLAISNTGQCLPALSVLLVYIVDAVVDFDQRVTECTVEEAKERIVFKIR